jgi:hypothetical protein
MQINAMVIADTQIKKDIYRTRLSMKYRTFMGKLGTLNFILNTQSDVLSRVINNDAMKI